MTKQMISTATEQVTSLTASLTTGLKLGERYVQLLDQLATATVPTELLDAAGQLVEFDLNHAYVKFPQHYQPEDYYLLLMGRLLELAGIGDFAVKPDPMHRRLAMRLTTFENDYTFCFEQKRSRPGAFFCEQTDHEPLFNLDLAHHSLQFNNRALVDFLIVKEIANHNDLELQGVVKPLVAFANLLAEQLGFTINLGILATDNAAQFKLAAPELSLTVIDKLFVQTAETDTVLLSLPQNNGAKLALASDTALSLAFDPDDYTKQWFFMVTDAKAQLSFLDVLLHYPLVRDWYLANRSALAIRDDQFAYAPVDEHVVVNSPATDAEPIKEEAPASAVEEEDGENDA